MQKEQLIYAEQKRDKAKEIIDSKISPIFNFIENDLASIQNNSEDAANQIRVMLAVVQPELEMLCEEIVQQVEHCVEERKNVRIMKSLSGAVGVGTAAITLASGGLLTFQFTLSNPSTIGLVAVSALSVFSFANNTTAVNDYNKAIKHLGETRSIVLENIYHAHYRNGHTRFLR